ncbi:hypothetical protein FE257_012185 [Aspergillus nanangensis]|uniref:Uncharacterized protein n=1 Tax=Aspergillus nanangensis TaxID=2582783 RepID=A0AAD4GQ70_ASPNN|nr:hypothetical protein FE257_012185 [Aspergillus nanangensis]
MIDAELRSLGDAPEPMLYPCRIRHTRLIPTAHSFSYSYLWAMVPIRWNGTTYHDDHVRQIVPRWMSIRSQDYLSRGGREGLNAKLHQFLDHQEMHNEDYPYVLLFTAPRVLGYSFNPVSFWYLYSAQGVLTAALLEVNNTFGERHIYPLTSDNSHKYPSSPARPYHFTCRWPKEFHVSPFNPRDGTYSLATVDPIQQSTINSRIALITTEGTAKLIASIRSTAPPFTPSTTQSSLRLLLSLSGIGFSTVPRIVIQAAQLFFLRNLPVWTVPTPRERTLCRRANTPETWFESTFHAYLDHQVRSFPHPVILEYWPAGIPDTPLHIIRSSSVEYHTVPGEEEEEEEVPTVQVRVLRPDFYTGLARLEGRVGFTGEQDALLCVSRPEILAEILRWEATAGLQLRDLSLPERIRCRVICCMRAKSLFALRSPQSDYLSAMDQYVMAQCDPGRRSEYQRRTVQILFCFSLAFGRWGMFRLQIFAAQIFGVWALLRLLYAAAV